MGPQAFLCLLCNCWTNPADASDEHIIPNALGGKLTTKLATCKPCNSRAGEGVDAALDRHFRMTSALFDVLRTRKYPPIVPFTDRLSGKRYEVNRGKVVGAPNFAWRGEGADSLCEVTADTPEEAFRLVKKFSKKSRFGVPHPKAGPNYVPKVPLVSYALQDGPVLQAIAKIAAVFARYVGLSLPPDSLSVAYARGLPVVACPVGGVFGDPVFLAEGSNPKLGHGVFLRKEPGRGPLVGYVYLFDVCEYSVLLHPDLDGPELSAGHVLDIVTGRAFVPEFGWTVETDLFALWCHRREHDVARVKRRTSAMAYWFRNMPEFWATRAAVRAVERLNEQRRQGASEEKALMEAEAELKRVLAIYEFDVQSFSYTETDLSPDDPE